MQSRQIIIIGVVALASLGTGFLLRELSTEAPAPAPAPVTANAEEKIVMQADPRIRVLTVQKDLSAGTVLKSDDLIWQEWPQSMKKPDYIVQTETPEATKNYEGSVLLGEVRSGEPLFKKNIVKPGEGSSMSALMRPGMRLYTINISPMNASGGFIMPGDHVDIVLKQTIKLPKDDEALTGTNNSKKAKVIQLRLLQQMSQKYPGMFNQKVDLPPPPYASNNDEAARRNGTTRPDPYADIREVTNKQIWSLQETDNNEFKFVETIMSNVKVLAIDSSMQRGPQVDENNRNPNVTPGLARNGSMATLEVTAEQAEFLTLAADFGSMSLMLRSLTDSKLAASDNQHDDIPKISGFFGRAILAGAGNETQATAGIQTAPGSMTIMRAGVISTVSFADAPPLKIGAPPKQPSLPASLPFKTPGNAPEVRQ